MKRAALRVGMSDVHEETTVNLRRALFSKLIGMGLLTAAAAVVVPLPASAQGLFDFFFGSRRQGPPPNASAYSDPSVNPFDRRGDVERRPSGPSVVYCVRLCDGRYFPIQRSGNANPAQLCNAFCPAAQTRTFSGAGIDYAVANDGGRYASLPNAFAYRERTVENCTCNGRDAYGIVTPNVASDPTLRPGDIIATNEGFVSYNGGGHRSADFTPIESTPGLSPESRQRLTHTRIVPNNATPVSIETIRAGAGGLRDERDRRVQLDR
jgi:hypothetical protein